MYPAGTRVGLVIQAIKSFGKENINNIAKTKIIKFLAGTSKEELTNNLKYAPLWIRTLLFYLMEDIL
jgi:hypothetical protein